MSFQQEADPSGVKGLLALLRSNQDGSPSTAPNRPATIFTPPTTHSASFNGSSHTLHAADRPTMTPTAPTTDGPSHQMDHSYLANWQTQTQALNRQPKPTSSRATVPAHVHSQQSAPGSTAATNPELMALLNTLRTSTPTSISAPPQPSRRPAPRPSAPSPSSPQRSILKRPPPPSPSTEDSTSTDPSKRRKLAAPSGMSIASIRQTVTSTASERKGKGREVVVSDEKKTVQTPKLDGKDMPFREVLGILAALLEDDEVVQRIKKIKQQQDDTERDLFAKREKIIAEFDRRIGKAADRNDPTETTRLESEKQHHLHSHDLSLLQRFDELVKKQGKELEVEIGVPGLGVGIAGESTLKRREKVMRILEGAVE